MPLTASAVIGGLSALTKIGTGIGQGAKADRLEEKNKRPVFNIEQEYFDNRDVAANAAQHGLSEAALDYQRTNAERGLSASLSASLETGGGVNSATALNDSFNRSVLQTAAADSEARHSKVKDFIDQNATVAGQKTQSWVLNKYEPYKDTAQAVARMRGAGQQNIQTGLGELTATAANYATARNNQDLLDDGAPPAGAGQQAANARATDDYESLIQPVRFTDSFVPKRPVAPDIFGRGVVPPPDLDYESLIQHFDYKPRFRKY